jgi:hypothetical protein
MGLAERLAGLPINATSVASAIEAVNDLAVIGPALEKLQLISTIGAAASVANLGVSLVGFAVVLHRLNRIEGKLDAMMSTLDVLKSAVGALGGELQGFLLARLSAAHANLDRAVAATTERERLELARDARRLFQESRLRYLQLWKQAAPWESAAVEVSTALELQARYTAAAIGELQAELLLGDAGAFRHVCHSASDDVRNVMAIDPVRAFRVRTDAACSRVGGEGFGPAGQASYIATGMDLLGAQIRLAVGVTTETADRLQAFDEDAQLPAQLGLAAHEILAALKSTTTVDVVALGSLNDAET